MEYLLRTTVLITVGVVVANILMETNLTEGLSRPVGWFCRASNLPQGCMMSVLACVISPTAGKATLSEYYRRGQVGETETALALLMSTFPIVLGESLFRVQAPVAVVLLGPVVGGIYVMLNLFSSFIQSFGALLYSRLRQPSARTSAEQNEDFWSGEGSVGSRVYSKSDRDEITRVQPAREEPLRERPPGADPVGDGNDPVRDRLGGGGLERNGCNLEGTYPRSEEGRRFEVDRAVLAKGVKRSLPALKRTLPVVVATMLLMDLLMSRGLIEVARTAFDPLLRLLGLPGDCIAPMVMQLVHFSAGYAAVAALLDAGSITEKQALITLVAGSMAVITMIYVRYSLAMYFSLFGSFGARLTAITYLASMIAKVITILLLLLF